MSIQNFHGEIQNALDHANLNSALDTDPNLNYNTLHKIIQQAKLKLMPIKLVKFNKYKHKISPWIMRGILQSIQYRDNLYKKHKMTDAALPEFDIRRINLKTYNNVLKKDIQLAKPSSYEALFNKFKYGVKFTCDSHAPHK